MIQRKSRWTPVLNVVYVIYLLTFLIPFEMIAVPLYKTAESLHLIDTYAALVLP